MTVAKFLNEDRNRYYGLRIGDIVACPAYEIAKAVVVDWGVLDNNSVMIKVDGEEPRTAVAEWCNIITKVEDLSTATASNITTLPKVLEMDFTGKNVLIIGRPGSGKTYLSNLLADKDIGRVFFHTDDYKHLGFEESLYGLMSDLNTTNNLPAIIEGVQGYRLLRKGVQMDCYYPDVVIELIVTDEQIERTYTQERDEKKLKFLKAFEKTNAKILADYKALPNEKPPVWITVLNSY